MQQGIQQQRGAALVIVLAFLTGALVVGISGMQSSLIDERLAGNYHASAQAQMNAERAAAQALVQEYNESDAQKNWEHLKKNKSVDSIEDVKQLLYADMDADNPAGKTNGECASKGENEDKCLYFPLKINEKYYWVAFGAVIGDRGEGRLISQHVVLVKITFQGDSSVDDIKEKFNQYGILSGDEVDVDSEEKNIPFYGLIHGDGNDADDEENLDVSFKNAESDDLENSGFSTEYEKVPNFSVSNYFKNIEKGKFDGYLTKESRCSIGSVDNVEQYCEKEINIAVASISQSTIYFADDVTVEDTLKVAGSTIFVDGNLTVKRSINSSAAGGVSNIIVTGDVVFDVDGRGEQDEESDDEDRGDKEANDDEKNNPVGLDLSNTVIVSGDEVEFGAKSSQGLRNVLIMSADDMDIDFYGIEKIDKGWFYSGGELDMEIDGSSDMMFCGSLMAQEDVDFDADPSIESFKSSGRNGCPEFSGFDVPLNDGGGKPEFDTWE